MSDKMPASNTSSGEQSSKPINTDGGAYVEGNVNTGGGHFIGRDWVQNFFGSSEEARNRRNHQVMRQLVRSFWIDGVLKSSLYNEVLIRLNLEEKPDAVDNRLWDLILKQPGEPDYSIPAGTPIIDVFDRMNGMLLILGEPGSGKTTTLLELADELLNRADEDPTHPTPVVFNLSSWVDKRPPLAEWLIDELRTKYSIPKKVAQEWIDRDELLLLLDGLDEVRSDHSDACAEAINTYRQEHFVPLVVCSRTAEYEDLAIQLKLQGAVLAQPLTLTQIDEYLEWTGSVLSVVRSTLNQDAELQELASSPLMLSIMVLAYQGLSSEEFSRFNSRHTRRRNLFNAYILRMFAHRGTFVAYPIQKTLTWLSWLAARLHQDSQSIFLIEQMRPSWLTKRRERILYSLISWFMMGFTFGLLDGLIQGLRGTDSQIVEFTSLGVSDSISVMVLSLLFSIANGIFLGLIVGILDILIHPKSIPYRKPRRVWIIITVAVSVLFGPLLGLFYVIHEKTGPRFMQLRPANLWSWQEALTNTLYGMLLGIFYGSLGGLGLIIVLAIVFPEAGSALLNWVLAGAVFGIVFGLRRGMTSRFLYGMRLENQHGVVFGLFFGILCGALSQMIFRDMAMSLVIGVSSTMTAILLHSGLFYIQYWILRSVLTLNKRIVWNYARFLDHCHERIFLRKVGGGYIFIHRMLMEHFANMTDEDIERIAREVEAGR